MSAAPLGVLIVDDEPRARERLERLVAELPGWTVVGTCASGLEALDETVQRGPAVVLLDIRMPGMTGIEAARHLAALEAPPAVVFTTAYDEYALEAFESHAVGYLLKPVRKERLEAALKHASRLAPPQLERLAAGGLPLSARRHLAARVRDRLRLIPVEEILYLRADQKYVTVRHLHGEDLIDESLRQLEQELEAHFVRIHRSLLAGVAHIEALERAGEGYVLRMRHTDEALPVSRRQLADVKRRLAAAPRKRLGI
ncbi:MAG TPA: LytTR family DNA-binding domain-containing protein [Gammaproteobacteria bacterium]|nr:LytTR family DNA-binding domain-containing protein [Gammaproteobacteria bacterium]